MEGQLFERVDAQYVLDHIGKVPIVDVRPENMYEQGHIPGARNIPLMDVIGDADGYLDDAAFAMARHFEEIGIMPDDEVIVYCHSGHLATEACMLLYAVGFSKLRCYRGSWLDWETDPSRPVEGA